MKIDLSKLPFSIEQGLLPVYMVSGDEPLQQGEAVDCIRRKARADGYLNREVLHVEGQFDWNQFPALCLTQSLFADKNLIELNLPTAKPGKVGGAVIERVMGELSPDNVIIIIAGKLDPKAKNTKWYKAVDKQGGIIQVWPLEGQNLASWLRGRVQKKGLQLDNEGLRILLQRIEGNLLAAVQEVEKLYSLYGTSPITANDVALAVEDNARFDVFKLTDSMLLGHSERVSRVLSGLIAEKLAAPVILWAITRELRLLEALSFEKGVTGGVDKIFQKHRVWDSKKGGYLKALSRGTLDDWQALLVDCVSAEKMIKGAKQGNEWVVMEQICLRVCQPSAFKTFAVI
ncbi:MAG: DNA polymerase III subunit delta [Piscirickettsiaceae bacterium]|nr:MAG: DNA polymerase III subunit delta [Piscirickettsiaceae bacterium]PCI71335.1 MAG: DNA polymerase III subunit delta [Piscirickettsiaceae bacterium]